MDVYEAIRLRKSVRAWQDRDVPENLLSRILDAARLAPSARNLQEWRFIIVRDPKVREALTPAANNQAFVGQAPVVLACCADTNSHVMRCGQLCYPIDLACVIDHITLLATAEGLGTCWIGAFYEDQVRKILDVPEAIRIVALLPIGWPVDAAPAEKNRLPLSSLLHFDRWVSRRSP